MSVVLPLPVPVRESEPVGDADWEHVIDGVSVSNVTDSNLVAKSKSVSVVGGMPGTGKVSALSRADSPCDCKTKYNPATTNASATTCGM